MGNRSYVIEECLNYLLANSGDQEFHIFALHPDQR